MMNIQDVNASRILVKVTANVPALCAVASFGTDYFLANILFLAKSKREFTTKLAIVQNVCYVLVFYTNLVTQTFPVFFQFVFSVSIFGFCFFISIFSQKDFDTNFFKLCFFGLIFPKHFPVSNFGFLFRLTFSSFTFQIIFY